jgi:TrpR-related protein YerC/YecD
MMQVSPDDWRSPDVEALFDALLGVETREEAASFLRDLCTLGELRDLAQRWAVVRLLDAGLHYSEISRRTGASTATITRIASWLNHGAGGYRLMLDRTRPSSLGGDSSYPEADTSSYPEAGTTRYPVAPEVGALRPNTPRTNTPRPSAPR